MTVRFACGHSALVDEGQSHAPTCLCGETRVARVFVRAPSFRGAVQGPYAQTQAVDSARLNLAPSGPLMLKDLTHG